MNTKRYLLAGTASVLFHSLVFSAIPNTMVMAMPVGTESTRVSLNLVSVPQQAPKPQTIAEAPAPTKAVKAKPKKEVKTEQKRLVKKPKVTEEKAVKQPVTKDIVKKATPKKKQPVVKKDAVNPAEKTTKPKEEMVSKADSQPKPEVKAQEAAGVNSPPQLVNKPNFSSTPSPVSYPKIAQRRALEGKVLFEVWIDSSGKQIKQILVKSSGTNVLDDAALAAIKRWQFSSYIVDGQAIAHRVHIPVRFKLD